MSLSFPTNPTVGQIYQGWKWDGARWVTGPAGGGPGSPIILGIQVFTTSGTYTPTAGMNTCMIECVGGGGGGGSITGSTATVASAGGGGGGGYSRDLATAADIGTSIGVIVGAGGLGGTGTTSPGFHGGNGGNTSVGTLCLANGGNGGQGSNYNSGLVGGGTAWGLGGSTTGAVGDLTASGGPGSALVWSANQIMSITGGNSIFGGGGVTPRPGASIAYAGGPGLAYGGGGSGSAQSSVATNLAGGAGAAGVVIITEYAASSGLQGPQGIAGANGAGYAATSTSSVAIGAGTLSATIQSGLAYSVGARVRFTSRSTGYWVEGVVTAYNAATGAIAFSSGVWNGSGSQSDWNVNVAGNPGATGLTGGEIPSGTVMLFYQAGAPVGWTQSGTDNDKLIRVVSGSGGVSGGSNPFSTVNAAAATGGHGLALNELPDITSANPSPIVSYFGGNTGYYAPVSGAGWSAVVMSAGSGYYVPQTGGSMTYVNNVSVAANAAVVSTAGRGTNGTTGATHTHSLTLSIEYCDIILASKN